MNNYNEVFQLAQDKGYKQEFSVELINEDVFMYHNPEMLRFIDLCLIQKWLRDEHKIHIDVSFYGNKWYADLESLKQKKRTDGTIRKHTSNLKSDETDGSNVYEDALLNGISEALKII
jgi:hypothetical protein